MKKGQEGLRFMSSHLLLLSLLVFFPGASLLSSPMNRLPSYFGPTGQEVELLVCLPGL